MLNYLTSSDMRVLVLSVWISFFNTSMALKLTAPAPVFDAWKEKTTMISVKEHRGASEILSFDLLGNNFTFRPILSGDVELRNVKRNTEKRPAIGLCVTGLARTFPDDLVHKRYKDLVISPLRDYADLSSFFLLAVWDDERNKLHLNENEYSRTAEVVSGFSPSAALVIKEGDKFPLNENCKMPSGWKSTSSRLRRWYFQWTKVKTCYKLMDNYEKKSGGAFDFMVRVRSDLLFLQRLMTSLMFQPQKIIVPKGIVGHARGGINDHIAACPRALCSSYFEIVDTYEHCTGPWESYMGHAAGGDDGNVLLSNHLNSLGAAVQEVFIDYTIYRACPVGPECHRLPISSQLACHEYSCPKKAKGQRNGIKKVEYT